MSDAPPIGPTLYGGLTLSEFTSARTAWTNAGLSGDSFDRQMGVAPGSVSMPAPSATPSGPPNANQPAGTYGSTLTPEQVAAATRSLRQAGVSADKIQAALEADGLTVATDDRTDEQAAHDREWQAGPYDPSMYRDLAFKELAAQANWPLEQQAQLNGELKEYMADLRLDPNLGPSLMEHALNLSAKVNAMSPADREAWRVNGSKEIRALYNSDEELNEVAENIRAMLELPGVDHPLTARMKSGILADKWLWQTLAAQAEHLVNWAGSRPDKVKK